MKLPSIPRIYREFYFGEESDTEVSATPSDTTADVATVGAGSQKRKSGKGPGRPKKVVPNEGSQSMLKFVLGATPLANLTNAT